MGSTVLILVLGLLPFRSLAVTHHRDLVSENGTRFYQRVDIDRKAGIEIFHVPAHNGLMELREMYDFNKGLALRCHPKIKACYLAEFDRKKYVSPARLQKGLSSFEKHHGTPKAEERKEHVVRENLVVVDATPVKNVSMLSPRMRKFLGTYNLYREAKVAKNAQIITDGGKPLGSGRGRRSVPYDCSKCRNNGQPVTKTVYTPRRTSSSCERATYRDKNGRYHYQHMRRYNYYKCCCCPEHNTAQQCWGAFKKCTFHGRYYG